MISSSTRTLPAVGRVPSVRPSREIAVRPPASAPRYAPLPLSPEPTYSSACAHLAPCLLCGVAAFTLSVGGSAELRVDGAVVASSKHSASSRVPCRPPAC